MAMWIIATLREAEAWAPRVALAQDASRTHPELTGCIQVDEGAGVGGRWLAAPGTCRR